MSETLSNTLFWTGANVAYVACRYLISRLPTDERKSDAEVSYEIVTSDGEWCAAASEIGDAMHYASVYNQDGPIQILEVQRRKIEQRDEIPARILHKHTNIRSGE